MRLDPMSMDLSAARQAVQLLVYQCNARDREIEQLQQRVKSLLSTPRCPDCNNELCYCIGEDQIELKELKEELACKGKEVELLLSLSEEIERLRAAIYESGESPMEQRVQIDPVQYLRTRYVSVTEHHRQQDAMQAEIERLRERLRQYEPEPGLCEHGVRDGDWCETCNREMKAARAAGGDDE